MTPGELSESDEKWWRANLLGSHSGFRMGRLFLRHLPDEPRCKLCAAPFGGIGAPIMRLVGKRPWPKNPKYCSSCFAQMEQRRGGLEFECSLLFADVRGSTPLAEELGPAAFRALMSRFYDTAVRVLVRHEAIVDKFVGDEVIGIFIPALAGQQHAGRAIAAGQALLQATGHDTADPWVPIGVGVHTGVAFVGTIGEPPHIELTAMGDPVNVTARLASAAGAGEMLVTFPAAESAELITPGLERRDLELKGKTAPTTVLVLGA